MTEQQNKNTNAAAQATNTASDQRTATVSPPFKIETPQTRARYLKLLVYGNFGVGKTTLAASSVEVPSMKDVLLLDAESGDFSLSEFDGLSTIRISNFPMLSKVHEYLKQHCAAREAGNLDRLRQLEAWLTGQNEADIEAPKQFRTVIMDSLTEVEAFNMDQLLGIGINTALDEEVATAEWSEYKKNNKMMARIVRAFRDLPLHVIFVASQSFVQDEMKQRHFSPALTGKLANQVQGFMDMVGYYHAGKPLDDGTIPRRLFIQPQNMFDAKNRFSKYKHPWFDNPTMLQIAEAIGLPTELEDAE